jgi:6-pyruvoyl-tetrahydropterin synthase-like protein
MAKASRKGKRRETEEAAPTNPTVDSQSVGSTKRALPGKSTLIASLVILVLATLILLPVFLRGFPNGDDAPIHSLWASEFANALREGVLYPRWLAGINHGSGSPAMIYYPPLTPYLHATLYLITGSVSWALAIGSWLALALSGFALYAFARLHLSRSYSLVAAMLYMAAPYHVFDLYHRSALAEVWAFAILPLVLYATHRVLTSDDWRSVAYLALGYCLILFTHLLLSFAITLLIVPYAIIITRDWRRMSRLAAGFVAGAGLAGIFIIPVVFERQFVRLDMVLLYDYRRVFLFENLRSVFAPTIFGVHQDVRFFIRDTDAIAVAALILFVVSAFLLWYKGRAGRRSLWQSKTFIALFAASGAAFFMTSRLSAPLWVVIRPLQYMQFPVRWLTIVSIGSAVMAAGLFSLLIARPFVRSRILLIGMAAFAVLLNLLLSALIIMRAPFDPAGLQSRVEKNTEVVEYFPVWVRAQPQAQPSISVVTGDARVVARDDRGVKQIYTVTAEKPSVVRFVTYYFPGWVARLDGKEVKIVPASTGHIHMDVDPGEHTVSLSFEDTPPRIAGKIVSLVSLLIFAAIFYVSRRRRR